MYNNDHVNTMIDLMPSISKTIDISRNDSTLQTYRNFTSKYLKISILEDYNKK